ncbi:hypothetical protein VB711_23875 [Cronbergia sp. UHCC 0137]|uniref:hypothetical protein n=1 Tax=Cronbergia sp. UHCC 0137 TaxID=3110239 RepID=UPI002B21B911|nr:hypothetical protein [Cronbergia sp. UHCC 0137]MEA5620855.1 hypothetical protein [Cronbergia sp. UHCC 0137]
MNYCPCCSNVLLKHIRGSTTYWFCRTCWQEMPIFTGNYPLSLSESLISKITEKVPKEELISTA